VKTTKAAFEYGETNLEIASRVASVNSTRQREASDQ